MACHAWYPHVTRIGGSTRGTHFLAKTARPRFHRYQPISNTETLSATPQPRYIDFLAELDVSNNNETISIRQTCNYTAFESSPSEAGFRFEADDKNSID
ncbi:hypothetical protein CDAR_590301 [Caerostris darwini]|uniref:Uncharacterized protein n=1 Tax=Caerostris darwini TaxID=1538125 RepID=A0AAV4NN91_9ARAC|nr:hypothetical protein CDAR_590301 [Caerostris darwini]